MPLEITYILLFLLVLQINIVPAFMPPTWIVLAFFYLHFPLRLWVVVIVGALAATTGRVGLAYGSKTYLKRFVPKKIDKNYSQFGQVLQKRAKVTLPLIFLYAFLPIPSNQVFIAVGLAEIDIRLIAASFFLGRLISYAFWVSITSKVTDNISNIFSTNLLSVNHVLIEAIGLGIIIGAGFINWKKLFR